MDMFDSTNVFPVLSLFYLLGLVIGLYFSLLSKRKVSFSISCFFLVFLLVVSYFDSSNFIFYIFYVFGLFPFVVSDLFYFYRKSLISKDRKKDKKEVGK